MKNLVKFSVFALLIALLSAPVFAGGSQGGSSGPGGSLPRNETLYYSGVTWGGLTHFNPFAPNGQSSFGVFVNAPYVPNDIYETLFLYNPVDDKLYPQIGESYRWDGKSLIIKLREVVQFNDGQPLTSADVVYSFDILKQYTTPVSFIWNYLDSVTAPDKYTVILKGKENNYNPKHMLTAITGFYIVPKHVWTKITTEIGSDSNALIQYANWEPIGSGPYKPYMHDETKVVLIRNDSYWGKHPSAYGKLPGPKYLAQNFYKENSGGETAYRQDQVDVAQQFVPNLGQLKRQNPNIKTYIDDPPYFFPGIIPFIIFNVQRPGLNDPAVRRAIVRAIDYDAIDKNANSGYSGKFNQTIMLPIPSELALIDQAKLRPYQWNGIDIAAANKILDDAGWVPGSDGIRAKGGVKLSFKAECPAGWSDWNATLEIISQSVKPIGIDIQTYFPEQPVWVTDRVMGNFDIIMQTYGGSNVASPWSRVYEALSSVDLPPQGTPTPTNWGRWVNNRADTIIKQIATETDPVVLKDLWTELNIIYLQEQPCAVVSYRAQANIQYNTSVWEGFPSDRNKLPPFSPGDAYAFKSLFDLAPKKK